MLGRVALVLSYMTKNLLATIWIINNDLCRVLSEKKTNISLFKPV